MRLQRKAEEAEEKMSIHGVSASFAGSDDKPDWSSATRSSLEGDGFIIRRTPSNANPHHVTIELPKPITKEVADAFNRAFGRID